MLNTTMPIILASASPVRKHMLEKIGLPIAVMTSPYDEESAKSDISQFGLPKQALALAKGKAAVVSEQHHNKLVIGADQIGEFNGNALFKPNTIDTNIQMLLTMQGHSHQQHTAAVVYLNGESLAEFIGSTTLHMRSLSQEQITHYVKSDQPYFCCGGYRYEGLGRCLFHKIDGAEDIILGLPLTNLLNYLYDAGYICY